MLKAVAAAPGAQGEKREGSEEGKEEAPAAAEEMVVVVPDSEYMTELLREGTPNESLHGGQQPEPAVPVRLSLECVLFRGIKKVGVISRRMPGEYAYVDVTVCLRCRELMFLVYEPGTCRFFPTFYAAKSRQALVRDFREMNTEAVSIQISVMLSELVLVDDPTKTTDAVVCAFGDSLAADMAAGEPEEDYSAQMDKKSEELVEAARHRMHAAEHAASETVVESDLVKHGKSQAELHALEGI